MTNDQSELTFRQAFGQALRGFAKVLRYLAIIVVFAAGEMALIWFGLWIWLVLYLSVGLLIGLVVWARDIQRLNHR